MKKIVLFIFIISAAVFSQDDLKEKEKALKASTDITFEANKELADNDFIDAEVNYRRAISKSNDNTAAPYNLGNAYYTKESFSEAFGRFKQAGELTSEKPVKHKAFHNMGNVFMKNKEYAKAVEAYKEALRNDPSDEETRYNLALAKELLKKDKNNKNKDDNKENQDQEEKKDKNQDQQDQGDNKDENKGDPKDEEKDSNEGDKGDQEKEENKKGDGDEKKEEKKQPEQGDQQQQKQPRPNQLSQQQIKNLLEAMQNEEKKVKEKMDAQKVKGVKTKNEKDW